MQTRYPQLIGELYSHKYSRCIFYQRNTEKFFSIKALVAKTIPVEK
ncbi:hypothetical protein SAMN04515695_2293 [Pseudovibrio sp. Tun.PSC04-5.I4]|nr:hypothetical protein SAMN04515695_2293 [Pseudovibrio sp. Tun.PSC04-5.I4]